MRRLTAIILCTSVLLLLIVSTGRAAGLRTTFSEVKVENVCPGTVYSTQEVAGLPLSVVNTSGEPIDLAIELLLPGAEELKEGYVPIPDLSWVHIEKTEFIAVPAGEAATTDVKIAIPAGDEYYGKKYQVYIWSHSVGLQVGVGLKSRLLISIIEEVKEDK